MSFFSFIQKNKESYSLVLNFGSGSVSGGILKFTKESGVDMVFFDKESIAYQTEVSPVRHIELMKNSLALLLKRIQAVGLKGIQKTNTKPLNIDRVFCVFSSPWCVSQTKTIRIKENSDFKLTKKYLDELVNNQKNIFESGDSKTRQIIEEKIIQLKINGYPVTNFQNKLVRDLEISVIFTFMPNDILDLINKTILGTFNIPNIWCHSSSLVFFSTLRDLFSYKNDFISLNVTEEITDIMIVKDNIIFSEVSIPIGRNHFIRELSKSLNVSEEVANSMFNLHQGNNNNKLASLQDDIKIESIISPWIDKIITTLSLQKENVYITDLLFLISRNDISLYLKNKLEKKGFDILLADYKKIKFHKHVNDLDFKLILMFLDNLYKI